MTPDPRARDALVNSRRSARSPGGSMRVDVAGLPPSSGLQFFGEVDIDPDDETMTVTMRDRAGASLWSVDLEPR